MANEANQPAPKYDLKQVAEVECDRQLYCARVSPCGKVLAGGGYDGKVHRWAIEGDELKPLPTLEGHHGWVTALAFGEKDADEGLLFTADSWGQVRCQKYAGEKDAVVWRIDEGHDGWIRDLVIDANRNAVITCGRDRLIRSFAIKDGKATKLFEHEDDVFALALSPDGKHLAFGDWHGRVKLLDMASRKVVKDYDASGFYKYDRIQDVDGLRVLRFLDGGKTLLGAGTQPTRGATMQGTPTMLFFDVASTELKKKLEFGQPKDGHIEDVAVHPDGFLIAGTSGVPGNGHVFATRMQDEKPFVDHTKIANLHAIALLPSGSRFIATGTNRGSNGNGRRVDKDGNYIGNSAPVVLFELAEAGEAGKATGKQQQKKK